ncbi:MAG: hypothetical protein IBX61_02670 [Thermoleophilia bacterium]|nr:hypothetical protein [Thermoleophilia bacterium]
MTDIIEQLAVELSRPGIRLAIFIGAAGTGKTTLIARLADRLAAGATVGIVDSDIGQSHIGPPSTVAWGRISPPGLHEAGDAGGGHEPGTGSKSEAGPAGGSRGSQGLEKIPAESFYFTGAISPTGNLLPVVAGAGLMAAQALAACDTVLLDTTGLVSGAPGRALKQIKIDLLKPDLLVALEREAETAHIVDPFRFQKRPRVIASSPLPGAVTVTTAARARFRNRRFRAYFYGSAVLEIPLERTGLRFSRGGPRPPDRMRGYLVSLRDGLNTDLALGVIEDEPRGGILPVRAPCPRHEDVASILVGSLKPDLFS